VKTLHDLDVPGPIRGLADAVHTAGGRAWAVGGCVRDHLMGKPVKDWDIEIHGLTTATLEKLLRKRGTVNAVGRSFGVFKLRPRGSPSTDPEIDVSIPRRDSNAVPGHRGIAVEGDPTMSIDEAVRRRDLTINALMVDVRTGELADPSGGLADLQAGRLSAVDDTTFLDDPLRALRVIQFIARTGFQPDDTLIALCRRAPLDELPAERIQTEWSKLLLRGTHIAVALRIARETDVDRRVFPERIDSDALDTALDRAIPLRDRLQDPGRQWALMLAIWLARTPPDAAEATLDRLWIHKVGGYPTRAQVLGILEHLDDPVTTDANLRHLSVHAELALLLGVHQALDPAEPFAERRARAEALGILTKKPAPLLQGRDLGPLGVAPGPEMGRMLKRAYQLQLDGALTTREEALDWAREAR
jgi:tRNA nucleotidyltransferase (CCA-adding enzyme)